MPAARHFLEQEIVADRRRVPRRPPPPRMAYRAAETAEILGLSYRAFMRRVARGEAPPHFTIRSTRRWSADALKDWLQKEEEAARLPKQEPKPKTPLVEGYVYIAGFGEFVKIGFSTNLPDRIRKLQTGAPVAMTVYAQLRGTKELERQLQERFAKDRLQGEWFYKGGGIGLWIKKGCPT